MAMNNKNTPSGKSLKMSADDLKEMVKAAVAECLGEEKEDTPPAEETAGEGMDVMSVIEEAVEAAAEKRKARKEAGEEVPEEITPDEIIAEAAAILDGLTAEEEAKADDVETEEKSEEEVAEGKAAKTTAARQTKKRTAAPAQRKYADIYLPRKVVTVEKKKIPADVQLARAVKCLDVFGRHDPEELGARKVPMANGNLNLPKMTSGARATWGGEARKISKSQPTFGNIKMSAKRLEAIVPQTRELLMSTDYSADALFANDLTRRMELGLDYGGMFGSGGEFQPLGIAKNKEVETVDATTLNNTDLASAGGKITADFPVWLVSKVLAKNVDDLGLGWTFNSFVEGYLKNLKTTTGDYIYREEMNGGKLLGFPYKVSNQIETASNKTTIIFGNWADLLVGEQLGLETYTPLDGSWTDENGVQHNAFEENLSATRALMYVDIAARHAESFIVVKNVAIA